MNINHRAVVLLWVVLLVASCAVPAVAQTEPAQGGQPAQPFRGLFGGNEADPRSGRQALNLRFDGFGAYEKNDFVSDTDVEPILDPLLRFSVSYVGGAASLDYNRRWSRGSFSATGGTWVRYFPDQGLFQRINSWGSAALSLRLGPRTSFNVSQGVAHSPYYSSGWFPGLTPPAPGAPIAPGLDNYTFRQPNYQFTTAANFTRRLTPNSSVSAFYDLSYTDFVNERPSVSTPSLYNQRAGALYQRGFTRYASLRLGYSYQMSRYGLDVDVDRRLNGHNIDAGIDYARPLRFGRRTTFGFSTGANIMPNPYPSENQDEMIFNLLVNAYLNTGIGRTWNANISYNRGLAFVAGFDQPYVSDAVAATISGYWGRRTNASVQLAYTNGTGLSTVAGARFGAYTGIAQIQYALARTTALYAQYSYYHYDTHGQSAPVLLVAQQFDRQGVRAGVTFWLPVLR